MNAELTYCLLAEIKSRKSNISSLIEIFQELVESLLANYYKQEDIKEQINDLRERFITTYHIEIPFPTLKIILSNLKNKYGDKFTLYTDYSYSTEKEVLSDSVKDLSESEKDIEELNKLFCKYSEMKQIKTKCVDLYSFIEQSKSELISFIKNPSAFSPSGWDESVVEFIRFIFGLTKYRTVFEKLLMGSIISSYFDVGVTSDHKPKTLLLDTNFIISLMDLHSEDSLITTNAILKLAERGGYSLQVLPETIKETRNLLEKKANKIAQINIFSSQRKHTIEGGSARRKLGRAELLVYAERIEAFLAGKNIELIKKDVNDAIMKDIETTEVYKKLINRPYNKEGVPHDAAAMVYVKSIRDEGASNFSEVNAFFVTDTAGFFENKISINTQLPYIIRAEELLNILWLSNPIMDSSILVANISRMMTLHLDKKLPDKEMLKRIDEKINNFSDLRLDENACVDLAMNIAEFDSRQLKDLIDIDEKELFRERILEMADYARRAMQERENSRSREYDELLIYLEDESKTEKGEILATMQRSLLEMQSTYDNYSKLKEKEHIEEMLIRDKEEKERIVDTISDLDERGKNRVRIVFTPFVLLSIIGVALFILLKVLPDWQNTESITYVITLIPVVITAMVYVFTGKTIKVKSALENIKKLICKSLLEKIDKGKNDIIMLDKRIEEASKRLNEIII